MVRSLALYASGALLSSVAHAWLPSFSKIRGVNLGSQFVLEPWLAETEWSTIGCSGLQSEWDCVEKLGQSTANTAFQAHWARWINDTDLAEMESYGLNTLRIPVGYWMDESLVESGEYFPQGGESYLLSLCDAAADRGFYIIIDLHGAPGAQVTDNADTGHYTTDGFYTTANYNRAVEFLSWMTNLIHTKNEMRNVGTLAVLNEPLAWSNAVSSLLTTFYPNAYSAIRSAESSLDVSKPLHVMFMNELWGAGVPTTDLPSGYSSVSFEDHRYTKWDSSVTVSQSAYLEDACTNNRTSDGETPTVVTEWCISPPDDVQDTSAWSTTSQKSFYENWFAAQASTYEKDTNGWIFWAWKSQLGDYRWSYKDAVAAGVIPTDLDTVASSTVCNSY